MTAADLPLDKLGAVALFVLLDKAVTFYFVYRMIIKKEEPQ